VVDGVRSPAPKLDESHEEPSTCKFILFQINGIDAAEKVVVSLLHLLTAGFGTNATCRDEMLRSARGGNPDIDQTSPNDRV
jgi:hypothetical protein